jgi:hypothetical protein
VVLGGKLATVEVEIITYHYESGMAKNLSKREYVTAIQQVIDRKHMTA